MKKLNRRKFAGQMVRFSAGAALIPGFVSLTGCDKAKETNTDSEEIAADSVVTEKPVEAGMFFDISLAQWSLHNALFAKEIKNEDFATMARNDFGISGVEYVNAFFKDKAKDKEYLSLMKQKAADADVQSILIMIDGEGHLGHTDEKERLKAIENHYKWVEAAQFLGCKSIRVNAAGDASAEEVAKNASDSLGKLGAFAKDYGISVLVENHGGYSSNGAWLADVIKNAGENCGTLPDFGNFKISDDEMYDRYKGTQELMPFAGGVSAKSHDFDADGNETHTDYTKMLKIVKDAGYKGFIGVEYEGKVLSERDGILATKALLEKVGRSL